MINTKRKGSRQERRSKAILESAGYRVTKSGASLGAFDLIGISATDFVLVQVKSNRFPNEVEMEEMQNFKCPPNCRKLIHRWRDRQRKPDVKEV